MTTTRIPAVIDYLVTVFRAAPTIGAATPPVAVYDGPQASSDFATLELWVGVSDPDDEGAPTSATSTQEWAALGKLARDEMVEVWLTASAWNGEGDLSAARTAVCGIVAAVETIARTDASLGGTVLVILPGPTQYTLRQNQTSNGAVAQMSFVISAKARI